MMAGVNLVHVPFGGNAPALTALLGGQIEVSVASLPSSIESIRTGKLHGLAVTSAMRSESCAQLTNGDRLFLVQLYRWFPSVLQAITIIRPAILVRWHRGDLRRYWRWKSC
jgi:hypothetical protein